MKLRQYQSKDCGGMSELFYDTVHTVNRRDYTEEQVCAWADGHVDPDVWNRSFLEHFTVIAEDNGTLVGFGDMAKDGYLDRLYVHRDHQGKGIGRALCDCMEQWYREKGMAGDRDGSPHEVTSDTATSHRATSHRVTTHASITARPFFEQRGYRVVKEQQVERRGQMLTNYVMVKDL
jgi:putative acetyltransferase